MKMIRWLWGAGLVTWLYLGCKFGIHVSSDLFEDGVCACTDKMIFDAKEKEAGKSGFSDLPEWTP